MQHRVEIQIRQAIIGCSVQGMVEHDFYPSIRELGRQILEFKNSLGLKEFRPRHGGNSDLRTEFHPASLLPVLTKAARSLNSFAMLIKMCLLPFAKSQGAKVKKC